MSSAVDRGDPTPRLVQAVGHPTLQRLQDRFAALGQVTVCVCTVDGEPIIRPTWGSRYSELIGTSPRGMAELAVCLRSLSLNPLCDVPPSCHEGLTLYAAPIEHGEPAGGAVERLAIIVVGTRSADAPTEQEAHAIARRYELGPDQLAGAVDRSGGHTGGTTEAARQFADVLADTVAMIYGQAERIHRQLSDLSIVHDLAEMLSGTLHVQQILDLTVRRVVEVLPVKACAIRLLDEDTGELVIRAVQNLSDAYLNKGPVTLGNSPIDAAALAGETVYIADAPNDPRLRYPQNARREGIVSGLCVPMRYRGRSVGVLRVYTARRYEFSDTEAALLRSIGSQAASAIINTRLFEEHERTTRFGRQAAAAEQIQRRMLPHRPPDLPGISFGCVYVPTLSLGGDFYDFVESPGGGDVGVAVADVVGKGMPAALMMASVRSALRASARRERRVHEAVAEVNRHLCRDTLPSEFASLVYVALAPDRSRLSYCNAGHPPPLLKRGQELVELTHGGTVIGVDPTALFEQQTLPLKSGDLLVLFTDGVTEALNFQSESFGKARLLAAMEQYASLGAQQLAKQILWDVRRFAGLAEQSDDITIVVVQVE